MSMSPLTCFTSRVDELRLVRAGVAERGEHLGAAAPVRRPRAFQVRDHDRHARMAADAVRLVHRVENRVELGTHVRRVDRARGGKRLGKRHHFLGRRTECGAVCESGTQPERAVRERVLELCAHRGYFVRRRGAVEPVHVVAAQRGMADQRRDVDRGLRGIDRLHVVRETRIREGVALAEQVHRIGRIAVERHRRRADPAVADDDGRHALRDLRQHLRRRDHVRVVMRVHIDKARRERMPVRFDHLLRKPVRQIADRRNLAVAQCDVALERRRTGAVVQRRADDQRICGLRMRMHDQSPNGCRSLPPRCMSSTYFVRRSSSRLTSLCLMASSVTSTSSAIIIA
jgi:hypothetical protein